MSSEKQIITPPQIATLVNHVYALVLACPRGRVTTYGWIGKALGYSRGAKMIGWIMNETPAGVPAHRVISSKGELTASRAFGAPNRMRELLEADGVTVSDEQKVDMKRYGWDPSALSRTELEQIITTVPDLHWQMSPRLLQLMHNDPASPFRSPVEPQP